MLDNKKINMVLSLLIAIALWAFVIGEVNPEATRVYRDIPIQLVHESVLDDSGLAVLSSSDTSLVVTITGTRSEVNQVRDKDIVATVDLSQAAIGENQLRIDVKVPSKVEVESQSINKVTVVVEEKVSKDTPVQVRYNGSFNRDEEPITIELGVEFVTVTGAATNIERVDHVEAVAAEGAVSAEPVTFDCRLVPVDVNKSKVYNVELSQDIVQVTAELATTKTVPLEVPIIEDENLKIERTITVPEMITLKGRTVDLEAITSIEAEPIDVNPITENKTISITPILPENVEVSSASETLEASIQVTKMLTKTFTLNGADLVLEHLGENLTGECLTEEIQVVVIGNQDTIGSMTKDNIVISVDVDGKTKGTYTVPLTVSCTVEGVEVESQQKNVKVKLQKEEAEDAQNGEDSVTDGHPDNNNQNDDSINNDNENTNENNETNDESIDEEQIDNEENIEE